MTRPGTRAGIAATVLAAIMWGSSFSVNDLGLGHMGPGAFVLLRFTIAAVVTLGILWIVKGRTGRSMALVRGTSAGGPPFWFWALCAANAAAFLLQYAAQTMTTPARTALFVNTSAFTVALIERVFFSMRLGPKRWLAIGLGFVGASVLIVGADQAAIARGRLLGDVLAMLAGFVWAIYFVANDRAVERVDPINLTAWTFAGTALLLIAAPLLDPWLARAPTAGLDATAWLAILYSGIVTTALAFGLWTYGLTRIRASISAVLLMVEILVASLVSIALGRESFGWVELVGAALLVGAVVLASSVATQDAVSKD
jgi:drug/metabolite transporter (DMT)-like permease